MVAPKQQRQESVVALVQRMQQRIESLERVVHNRIADALPQSIQTVTTTTQSSVLLTDGQVGWNTTISDLVRRAGTYVVPITGFGPRAYQTTTSNSVANNTPTMMTWAAVTNDGWSCWSAGAPTKFTVPFPGIFVAVASVSFVSNATGYRSATIFRNTTEVLATTRVQTNATSATQFQVVTAPTSLVAGDFLEVSLLQTSGGALGQNYDNNNNPSFSLLYLG